MSLPSYLKEPIEFGRPSLAWNDDELAAWFNDRHRFVRSEQVRKLNLLLKELQAPDADPNLQLVWLCVELAKKLYPGFCTELDGVKRKGAPRRADRAGRGGMDDPRVQMVLVDLLVKRGVVKTASAACKILLEIKDSGLSLPGRQSELNTKARSLASIISRTRASAGRKAVTDRRAESQTGRLQK